LSVQETYLDRLSSEREPLGGVRKEERGKGKGKKRATKEGMGLGRELFMVIKTEDQ